MTVAYECDACDGSGRRSGDWCDECDGIGVTAFDCVNCGRVGVPIEHRGFIGSSNRGLVCEPCGDRIAQERGVPGAG